MRRLTRWWDAYLSKLVGIAVNVKLTPKILDNSQKYIQEKYNTVEKPVDFVFHGGSMYENKREVFGFD